MKAKYRAKRAANKLTTPDQKLTDEDKKVLWKDFNAGKKYLDLSAWPSLAQNETVKGEVRWTSNVEEDPEEPGELAEDEQTEEQYQEETEEQAGEANRPRVSSRSKRIYKKRN